MPLVNPISLPKLPTIPAVPQIPRGLSLPAIPSSVTNVIKIPPIDVVQKIAIKAATSAITSNLDKRPIKIPKNKISDVISYIKNVKDTVTATVDMAQEKISVVTRKKEQLDALKSKFVLATQAGAIDAAKQTARAAVSAQLTTSLANAKKDMEENMITARATVLRIINQ
jgi:hypothetical protein